MADVNLNELVLVGYEYQSLLGLTLSQLESLVVVEEEDPDLMKNVFKHSQSNYSGTDKIISKDNYPNEDPTLEKGVRLTDKLITTITK